MENSQQAELLKKIMGLEVKTNSTSKSPVEAGGWYENDDGTLTRYYWQTLSSGARIVERAATVRNSESAQEYDRLVRELIFA